MLLFIVSLQELNLMKAMLLKIKPWLLLYLLVQLFQLKGFEDVVFRPCGAQPAFDQVKFSYRHHLDKGIFKIIDDILKLVLVSDKFYSPKGDVWPEVLAVARESVFSQAVQQVFAQGCKACGLVGADPDDPRIVGAPKNARPADVGAEGPVPACNLVLHPANGFKLVFGSITKKFQGQVDVVAFHPIDFLQPKLCAQIIVKVYKLIVRLQPDSTKQSLHAHKISYNINQIRTKRSIKTESATFAR